MSILTNHSLVQANAEQHPVLFCSPLPASSLPYVMFIQTILRTNSNDASAQFDLKDYRKIYLTIDILMLQGNIYYYT